ncbi:MAG: cation transporter [Ruminococcaceae bacterium]|nr:cation transporter [Oscillospiraceae bacterium]
MIKLIIRTFIKNSDNITDKDVRTQYGTLAGVLGIILNFILFAVKLCLGIFINSIAVISDSFNNLSDMGSSLVSAVGMKMSNRRPDKEHPFGHGRIEYISALIVSFIILFVGFELFKGSFQKILNPVKVKISYVVIIILCLSLLVKLWMFSYNRYIGKKINSNVICAAATDSLNDCIATVSVIIATVIGSRVNFPLDGIFGCIVSAMICWTGFSVAKTTVGILLGTTPDAEMVKEISDIIMSQENIAGIHDLIVHDYGPGRIMASVHAEVPNDVSVDAIHEVIDRTEKYIEERLGVHVVIHMDPISVNCERTNKIKEIVINIVKEVNELFDIHDFRMTDGEYNINLIFDLEVPCEMGENDRKEALASIKAKLKEKDGRYNAVIIVDNKY